MTLTCYVTPGKRKGLKVMTAFAAGCGGRVSLARRLEAGPAAFYGVSDHLKPLLDQARVEKHDWYYIDNGYFARKQYCRVSRDAMQHRGNGIGDADRFGRLGIEIRPWRTAGRHVLVCPQSDTFMRHIAGIGVDTWLADVLACLRRHTGREIRVRGKRDARPLAADLADCHAVVVHMSNAAVEALMAGVPVFATGPCAASAMGLADLRRIETPVRPRGRRRWAAVLAANQWTRGEMHSGRCWHELNPNQ